MLPKELNTIHSTKKPSKLDENKNSIYLSNMRNFGIWTPFRNKTAMFLCLINNPLRWTLCKNCIKSGRKKPKNLEIGTFQPFVVKFILDPIKDRGNMSTYYGKLSTKSIRQQIKPKKTHNKLDEQYNSIYLSNMRSVGIWTPFRIKIAKYFMTQQICINNS